MHAPSWPPGKAGICVLVGSSGEHLVADGLHRASALAIAVLGRGGGVVVCDVCSESSGPLFFMAFLAMVEKRGDVGDLRDDGNVARRSAELMCRLKARWPAIADAHMLVEHGGGELWQQRLRMYRHAVQVRLPDAFAGAAVATKLTGNDRFKK